MPSWPFEQAQTLRNRVGDQGGPVVFQTGYGPSGAPHIGTFGEVVRTQMVRRAFEDLTGRRTRLIVFSDDYDGLRKRPDGVPESIEEHLGRPLSMIPDPFGGAWSFGERNNFALIRFIENMGITDYEFTSATHCYTEGLFNDALVNVARHYDEIMGVILPTLREDRRATYSPFLPLSRVSGRVLQVPVEVVDAQAGIIAFQDEDGERVETFVGYGYTKLQWKVDWAMRWGALGVDYEMSGKDLIDSVTASSKITRILGHRPPVSMTYELFLDGRGEKISKSRGNGLSIEDWDRFSNRESLAYYMFQSPRSAKRLGVEVIARSTDDYLKALVNFQNQTPEQQRDNPVWHIHGGNPPSWSSDVSYGLLVNLASASTETDEDTLRGFLDQYRSIAPEDRPIIDDLIPRVLAFVREVVFPSRQVREPTPQERAAFADLADRLSQMDDGLDGEAYQFEVYEVGKAHGFDPLRSWFQGLYEVLFGASQGPRFGTFIAAYGRQRSIDLIRSRI